MTSRNGVFNYMGIMGAVFAGSMIGDYITTPNVKGVDQLRVAAALIQDYKGTSPEGALDSTLKTLNEVKLENPTYQSEIAGLEFTVAAVRDKLVVEQNPAQETIAMDSLADMLNTYAKDHYKNPAYLAMGGVGLLFSFGGHALEFAEENREQKKRMRYTSNNLVDADDNNLWRNQDTGTRDDNMTTR